MIKEWVKFIVLISIFIPFSQAVPADKRNHLFILLVGTLSLVTEKEYSYFFSYIYLTGYEAQFETRF